MKKILFATTNKNKVSRLINFLGTSGFEFLTLDDLGYSIEEPDESKETPLDIAMEKAGYYFDNLQDEMPVISQDDTIVIKINNIEERILSIKKPVEEKYGEFNDSNAIKYYINLATENGGEIEMEFRYGFGYADKNGVIGEPAVLKGKLVSQASSTLQPGYFLTAIFKAQTPSGEYKYMSEMDDTENAYADRDLKRAVMKLIA